MMLSLAKYEPSVLTLKVMAKGKLNTSIGSLAGILRAILRRALKNR